ncbi:MAG: hypothetical protein ACRD1V_05000 [Vicinamibacterales bacterium]
MRARPLTVDRVADDTAPFTFEMHAPFAFEPGDPDNIRTEKFSGY